MTSNRRPEPAAILFVHGEGPQDFPLAIKDAWDEALFGSHLGDKSDVAFYADIIHPNNLLGDLADTLASDADWTNSEASQLGKTIYSGLRHFQTSGDSRGTAKLAVDIIENMSRRYRGRMDQRQLSDGTIPYAKRLAICRCALDAACYFKDRIVRDTIRRRLIKEAVECGQYRFVLVSHGVGSVFAYDSLLEFKEKELEIPLWLNIGSPLGDLEFRNSFQEQFGKEFRKRMPIPQCVERLVNIVNWADPVVSYQNIHDILATSEGQTTCTIDVSDRDPHDAPSYLSCSETQEELRDILPQNFQDPIGSFSLAADVAEEIHRDPATAIPILIELDDDLEGGTLTDRADNLIRQINEVVRGEHRDPKIERLKRYVAAELLPTEIKRLRNRNSALDSKLKNKNHAASTGSGKLFQRIWKNYQRTSLLHVSGQTIQVSPARRTYHCEGDGIHWAVLDTGINPGHPHFKDWSNVVSSYDCTVLGKLINVLTKNVDKSGHGSHVAGIIAGCTPHALTGNRGSNTSQPELSGMAPRTQIHSYKVLDDRELGKDSWIIKALDHIAEINDITSSDLKIHGVNLSLGGDFDPAVYGCGSTPICEEVRRLWSQGVVVCIAAGNSGRINVSSDRGERAINALSSIGDPANLEEAIAVGSVHKESPRRHGVSYFSSRGPTADGRGKPDLVAPGERIFSVRSTCDSSDPATYYVEKSGTSFACPHVSGLIAAFLSVRREFIGFPNEVKRILLENCTDLGRDPYHQGAGMPNLMAMLANA